MNTSQIGLQRIGKLRTCVRDGGVGANQDKNCSLYFKLSNRIFGTRNQGHVPMALV